MFYQVVKILCAVKLATLRRWKVHGRIDLPKGTGAVVVANHISYLDPIAIGCAIDRKINFMGKAELFEIPVLNIIIKALGTFPVHRSGNDREAIRHSVMLLKSGQLVGIFPEGTRSLSRQLLDFHTGPVFIALKAGVPIIPVALKGTQGFWGRVQIYIGQPMTFPELYGRKLSKAGMEEITRQVRDEVARLLAAGGRER